MTKTFFPSASHSLINCSRSSRKPVQASSLFSAASKPPAPLWGIIKGTVEVRKKKSASLSFIDLSNHSRCVFPSMETPSLPRFVTSCMSREPRVSRRKNSQLATRNFPKELRPME